MIAKFRRRMERWNGLFAFVMTFVEALLTLTLLRFVFRMVLKLVQLATGRRGTALPQGAD